MLYMDTEAQLSPVPQIQPPPLCYLQSWEYNTGSTISPQKHKFSDEKHAGFLELGVPWAPNSGPLIQDCGEKYQ